MKATLHFAIAAAAVIGTSALLQAADASAASKRIDDLITQGLNKRQLKANPLVGDEVFLRRVYLTVIGRIPTLDEARKFLDSKDTPLKVMCIMPSTTGLMCFVLKARAWQTAPPLRIT